MASRKEKQEKIKRLYRQGLDAAEILKRMRDLGEPTSGDYIYRVLKEASAKDTKQHLAAHSLIKRDKLREAFLEDAKTLPPTELRKRYCATEDGRLLLKEYFAERLPQSEVQEGRKNPYEFFVLGEVLNQLENGLRDSQIAANLGLSRERVRQLVNKLKVDPAYKEIMPEILEDRELKILAMKRARTRTRMDRSQLGESTSAVGQEVDGFLALSFLGGRKPDGGFSKLKEDLAGKYSTYYYEVKCLNCGNIYARQKQCFIRGELRCPCRPRIKIIFD